MNIGISLGSSHYHYAVTQLQMKSRAGSKVDTGTVDPGDVQTELGPYIKLAQALAVDLAVGDHQTAGYQIGVQFLPCALVHLQLLSDKGDHHIRIGRRRDDQKLVSLLDN